MQIWQTLLCPKGVQSAVYNSGKLFGFIILDLGVDVHSYFAVFVSGQILNGLRIDASMDQVRDVGMPQQMRRHIEIEAISDVIPVDTFLPRLRFELLFDCLSVDIPINRSLLGTADFDVVPNALKL